MLSAGRVVAAGDPRDVLTPGLIRDVWGVEAHVLAHPATGRPLIAYSEVAGGRRAGARRAVISETNDSGHPRPETRASAVGRGTAPRANSTAPSSPSGDSNAQAAVSGPISSTDDPSAQTGICAVPTTPGPAPSDVT